MLIDQRAPVDEVVFVRVGLQRPFEQLQCIVVGAGAAEQVGLGEDQLHLHARELAPQLQQQVTGLQQIAALSQQIGAAHRGIDDLIAGVDLGVPVQRGLDLAPRLGDATQIVGRVRAVLLLLIQRQEMLFGGIQIGLLQLQQAQRVQGFGTVRLQGEYRLELGGGAGHLVGVHQQFCVAQMQCCRSVALPQQPGEILVGIVEARQLQQRAYAQQRHVQ